MAAVRCGQEVNELPVLTGCPARTEMFMVAGAVGGLGAGGYGLRSFGDIATCVIEGGIFLVYGDELVAGAYENSDYEGVELVIDYNGINRFLIPETEYTLLAGGGFQLLIGDTFTHDDVFVVFPNGQTA